MARTRASVGAKVAAGKSNKARCSAPPPSTPSTSGAGEKSSRTYSGGNPVCPRETPKWQKPITNFFIGSQSKHTANISDDDQVAAGPSKPRTKVNVIESDEEELDVTEPPKNQELDESIILEPLCGETSHKIEEYYANKDKQTKESDKENIDLNGNSKLSKRHLEEEDEIGQPRKKVKTGGIE